MQDGPTFLTSTDIGTITTTKTESYGKIGQTYDGRSFTYVGFGGTTAFTPGQLVVAATAPTNSTGLALNATQPTTGALLAGSVQLNVTNGATAVTQDQFAEGTLDVLGTNGLASYKIKGNSAAAASGIITVTLSEALRNTSALVAGTNTVNLSLSLQAGVVTSTTLSTNVGFVITPVPQSASQSYFGWVQVRGRGLAINDAAATLAKDSAVAQSTTVAGAVVANSAATGDIAGIIKESTVVSIGAPIYIAIY